MIVIDKVLALKIGTYPAGISIGFFKAPIKNGDPAVAELNRAKCVTVPHELIASGR